MWYYDLWEQAIHIIFAYRRTDPPINAVSRGMCIQGSWVYMCFGSTISGMYGYMRSRLFGSRVRETRTSI